MNTKTKFNKLINCISQMFYNQGLYNESKYMKNLGYRYNSNISDINYAPFIVLLKYNIDKLDENPRIYKVIKKNKVRIDILIENTSILYILCLDKFGDKFLKIDNFENINKFIKDFHHEKSIEFGLFDNVVEESYDMIEHLFIKYKTLDFDIFNSLALDTNDIIRNKVLNKLDKEEFISSNNKKLNISDIFASIDNIRVGVTIKYKKGLFTHRFMILNKSTRSDLSRVKLIDPVDYYSIKFSLGY